MADWPPKSADDVETYDDDEIVAGYREWRPDDPPPGDNRSPGYRWGWANRSGDHSGKDDGFRPIRSELIRRMMASGEWPFRAVH